MNGSKAYRYVSLLTACAVGLVSIQSCRTTPVPTEVPATTPLQGHAKLLVSQRTTSPEGHDIDIRLYDDGGVILGMVTARDPNGANMASLDIVGNRWHYVAVTDGRREEGTVGPGDFLAPDGGEAICVGFVALLCIAAAAALAAAGCGSDFQGCQPKPGTAPGGGGGAPVTSGADDDGTTSTTGG